MSTSRSLRRLTGAGVALVAALTLVLSIAAAGSNATAPRPDSGALRALPGAGGCLGRGCPVSLRGVSRSGSDGGIDQLVASTGGRTVYAVDGVDGAIAVLARDPRTGALVQLPGRRGCVAASAIDGCAVVPALRRAGTVQVSPAGTIVVTPQGDSPRRRVYHRDPTTGAVDGSATTARCVAAVDGPCVSVRAVTGHEYGNGVLALGHGTTLLTSPTKSNRAGALAIVHRGADGHWHAVAGPHGCFTGDGSGGCTKLPCMTDFATAAIGTDHGRLVEVGGGESNQEDTEGGYLATFRRTRDGGLAAVGCVKTAQYRGSSEVPVWLAALPHSDHVLVAETRGNRGDGIVFERLFVAHPGADGALTAPRQLSSDDVSGHSGQAVLALGPGATTLYAANTDGGSLLAERVSGQAVHPLPGRAGTPIRSTGPGTGMTAMLLSADRRFLYAAVGSADGYDSGGPGPTIRVFRTGG